MFVVTKYLETNQWWIMTTRNGNDDEETVTMTKTKEVLHLRTHKPKLRFFTFLFWFMKRICEDTLAYSHQGGGKTFWWRWRWCNCLWWWWWWWWRWCNCLCPLSASAPTINKEGGTAGNGSRIWEFYLENKFRNFLGENDLGIFQGQNWQLLNLLALKRPCSIFFTSLLKSTFKSQRVGNLVLAGLESW